MEKNEEIVNRVAKSNIITLDMEEMLPEVEFEKVDLADILFQGMILREKDLRQYAKDTDWETYKGKHVAVYCSADAVIPKWAYMILTTKLAPHAASVSYGQPDEILTGWLIEKIKNLDVEKYKDARVVIKGCGEKEIFPSAYIALTGLLTPVVKTLMFGEPCSTVPVYKKK